MREDHVAETIPERKKKAVVLHLIFLLNFTDADCMAAKVGGDGRRIIFDVEGNLIN
jgi:hypothetical protein